ncbi:hypothetical protein [Parathermosynechococcus lividus]
MSRLILPTAVGLYPRRERARFYPVPEPSGFYKLSMGAIALGLQQQLLSGRLKLEIDWGFTVRQRGALMVPV